MTSPVVIFSTPLDAEDPASDADQIVGVAGDDVDEEVRDAAESVHEPLRVEGGRSSGVGASYELTSPETITRATQRPGDRVSVKPQASPVLQGINYLLGELDEMYLTTLGEFGGLQSYSSRSKESDPVSRSTRLLGVGARLRCQLPSDGHVRHHRALSAFEEFHYPLV